MKEFNFYSLKVVKDRTVSYDAIETTFDAGQFFQELIGDAAEEHLVAVGTNSKGQPVCGFEISHGDISKSIVDPSAIFKRLLQFSNISGFFLAHNHPSGDVTFSNDDITVTKRISRASKFLGIRFLDHIVVSDCDYASAKADGIL